MENADYSKTYIVGSDTVQIFEGRGMLHSIVIGVTAAGAISVIDGTSGTTANVGEIEASAPVGTYKFNCSIANGLRIDVAAASSITVMWSQ